MSVVTIQVCLQLSSSPTNNIITSVFEAIPSLVPWLRDMVLTIVISLSLFVGSLVSTDQNFTASSLFFEINEEFFTIYSADT